MAESPETDHAISTNTHRSASDGPDRPHCQPDRSGGVPARSVDTHPDLSTMPQGPVLFVLAVFPEGLTWSKIHRFFLKIGVHPSSQRKFYNTQKLLVPSLFELVEADCDHYFKQATQGDVLSLDGRFLKCCQIDPHTYKSSPEQNNLILDD
jgi:hypothetical protein